MEDWHPRLPRLAKMMDGVMKRFEEARRSTSLLILRRLTLPRTVRDMQHTPTATLALLLNVELIYLNYSNVEAAITKV